MLAKASFQTAKISDQKHLPQLSTIFSMPIRQLRPRLRRFPTIQIKPVTANQRRVEVPGVGHNGDGMLTSPEWQKALFEQ